MIDAIADLIHRMEPEAFFGLMIPLTVVVGGILIAIAGMIIKHSRYHRDAALKTEMIARGMSAEEIERVLAAKTCSKAVQLSKSFE